MPERDCQSVLFAVQRFTNSLRMSIITGLSREKKSMLAHAIRAVCFVITLSAAPAMAQDVKITEAMVKDYYEAVYASFKLPLAEYMDVVKNAYRADFRSTVAGTFKGPGMQPMPQSDMYDYQKTIDGAADAHKAMQNATITHTTSNIRIAADGQSVSVTEATRIRGMKVGSPQGDVHVDTDAVCEDELALSAAGVLQAVKSACTAESTIREEREL